MPSCQWNAGVNPTIVIESGGDGSPKSAERAGLLLPTPEHLVGGDEVSLADAVQKLDPEIGEGRMQILGGGAHTVPVRALSWPRRVMTEIGVHEFPDEIGPVLALHLGRQSQASQRAVRR